MGIVWFIAWSVFVYDTPAKHPRIEAKELSYIQHCIGGEASMVCMTYLIYILIRVLRSASLNN